MLHRGIFTEHLPNRRLIQLFDIYPNENILNKVHNKILHIPYISHIDINDYSNVFFYISKTPIFLI